MPKFRSFKTAFCGFELPTVPLPQQEPPTSRPPSTQTTTRRCQTTLSPQPAQREASTGGAHAARQLCSHSHIYVADDESQSADAVGVAAANVVGVVLELFG